MTGLRFPKTVAVAVAVVLPLGLYVQGCREANSLETITVSLKNTDTYQYPTVGGDEDGARISTQATHFSISEIRREAASSWVATYVYQAAVGFVGSDSVGLDIFTGSDGASPPTSVRKVLIHFAVHD